VRGVRPGVVLGGRAEESCGVAGVDLIHGQHGGNPTRLNTDRTNRRTSKGGGSAKEPASLVESPPSSFRERPARRLRG